MEEAFPDITIIVRGVRYAQARRMARAAVRAGVGALEVSIAADGALDALARLRGEFDGSLLVGAGTVLTADDARRCIDAGASFLLSPTCLPAEVFELARSAGVATVPGAFSPTEIERMLDMGADLVKVFPARALGPGFFRDVRAPLGDVPLMAVGGVDAGNARDYFEAGACAVGVGSGCFGGQEPETMDDGEIERAMRALARCRVARDRVVSR